MITYGNNEVLLNKQGRGFEIRYEGSIQITNSPNNLFLSANRNKIIGVMIDNSDLPEELFNYKGLLKIISAKIVTNNLELQNIRAVVKGIDYWNYDGEKWEDDGSEWGTRNGTYGKGVSYNKKTIVVNNNLIVEHDRQFKYSDGSPVAKGTDIHIMNDGTAMTGKKFTRNSVPIFSNNNMVKRQIKRKGYSGGSSGGSGSSGGGGY